MQNRGGWTQNSGGRQPRDERGATTPSSALGAYVPPNSIEAEQSVLGAMLIERAAIEIVLEVIEKEHFYRETHQALFDAIVTLYKRSEPVDLVTVQEELKNRDKLDTIGGISYLTSLFETVPTAANVEYYAKIVLEKALLRELISKSLEVIGMARGEVDDIEEVIRHSQDIMNRVVVPNRQFSLVPMNTHLDKVWDDAETQALNPNPGGITGIETPYHDFNVRSGGWQRPDLIIIAARPSIGKTSLARRLALHAAKAGLPTAFFTAEMSSIQVTAQMICSAAQIDYSSLRAGLLPQDGWDRVLRAIGMMRDIPLYFRDLLPMSLASMEADLRQFERIHGSVGLIVVDYLQLLTAVGRHDSRTQEIGEISRGLKQLARRFNCPVIALSQLSRALERRENKRPMLSDLRESGDIEADADVVIALYREWYYRQQLGEPVDPMLAQPMEAIWLKHRLGPTGTDILSFVPRYARIDTWKDNVNAVIGQGHQHSAGKGRNHYSGTASAA